MSICAGPTGYEPLSNPVNLPDQRNDGFGILDVVFYSIKPVELPAV